MRAPPCSFLTCIGTFPVVNPHTVLFSTSSTKQVPESWSSVQFMDTTSSRRQVAESWGSVQFMDTASSRRQVAESWGSDTLISTVRPRPTNQYARPIWSYSHLSPRLNSWHQRHLLASPRVSHLLDIHLHQIKINLGSVSIL